MPYGDGTLWRPKGSRIWWYQVWHDGARHRGSTRTGKKSEARAVLQRARAEIQSGRRADFAARVTIADLVDLLRRDYEVNRRKSASIVKFHVRRIVEHFEPTQAADRIRAQDLNGYVSARVAAGAAPATIRNELSALRRMFTLAVAAGLVAEAPKFPTIRVRNARQDFLTEAQLADVLAFVRSSESDDGRVGSDDVADVIEFAALTGWRSSEVRGLRWRNVDFGRYVVRLDEGATKSGKAREFPFDALPALEALLRKRLGVTRDVERERDRIVDRVFHRRGRPVADFRYLWRRATEAAGAPGATFHGLRRRAVRNLESAGVPRGVAMALIGHETEDMYRRYGVVDDGRLRAGVAQLRDYLDAAAARAVSDEASKNRQSGEGGEG